MNLVKKSKFLSYVLRHNPDVISIQLDENGYADVNELVEKISKKREFSYEILEEIVAKDNKKRFAYNVDKTKIRACQGHTIDVDVQLTEKIPPDILYHGTSQKSLDSILQQGILPMSRLYVHLSKTYDTAIQVGSRHGNPVILEIDSKQMAIDGYNFYLSENEVWQTKIVPARYIKVLK